MFKDIATKMKLKSQAKGKQGSCSALSELSRLIGEVGLGSFRDEDFRV